MLIHTQSRLIEVRQTPTENNGGVEISKIKNPWRRLSIGTKNEHRQYQIWHRYSEDSTTGALQATIGVRSFRFCTLNIRCPTYVSVSFENLSISGYMGAISSVEGAEGALEPRCSLRDSSSRTSPNKRMDMFWPSKWSSKKSPTWNNNMTCFRSVFPVYFIHF